MKRKASGEDGEEGKDGEYCEDGARVGLLRPACMPARPPLYLCLSSSLSLPVFLPLNAS